MALGCGQVDLRVAASETSSLQSSSQKTRNQEPRLGLLLLSDNGTVALSPSKTRLCVHVMGQPLYRTTGKEKERQRDTHWLETVGGQDGDGDEISVMPVRVHFSSRLTRWPVLLSPAPHVCVPPCTSTGWVEIVRPSHRLPVCHSLTLLANSSLMPFLMCITTQCSHCLLPPDAAIRRPSLTPVQRLPGEMGDIVSMALPPAPISRATRLPPTLYSRPSSSPVLLVRACRPEIATLQTLKGRHTALHRPYAWTA